MKVIFYLPESNKTEFKFQALLKQVRFAAEVDLAGTPAELEEFLRRPRYNLAFVILVAPSREELSNLIDLGRLLRDVRIVLVLPDTDDETMMLGYKLYPRFSIDIADNTDSLEAVVEKMLENYTQDQNPRSRTDFRKINKN